MKPVIQISLDGKIIREFKSITEASKVTGINLGNISSCSLGIIPTAGGYVWKKKEENYDF